jgi:hypothetical protein
MTRQETYQLAQVLMNLIPDEKDRLLLLEHCVIGFYAWDEEHGAEASSYHAALVVMNDKLEKEND